MQIPKWLTRSNNDEDFPPMPLSTAHMSPTGTRGPECPGAVGMITMPGLIGAEDAARFKKKFFESQKHPGTPMTNEEYQDIAAKQNAEKLVEGNGIAPSPTLSVSEQLRSAAAEAEKHEADRAKWAEAYAKVSETIRDLKREVEFLRLELATRNNDMQTAQSTIEELRQANSDLRALHGALHAQAKHLVAQYENFSIPLPIRSRVKRNGKLDKAVTSESTVQSERAVARESTNPEERTALAESTVTKE